ncbi:hypothetical protein C2G38_2220468 [Gigaspora rosea]|uniref:Uncharacterized protein n=1 Tax=Gigaspora rosea TaxID=44941 RepID=A0A397U7V6_9GLOM|nr:hypothetical protein C2G38_2220468 [Gigaspora rosea]
MFITNNLQQLYLLHNGFNFYVSYYTKKDQTIRVRKSLRFLNKPQPHYQLTWRYIRKQFNNLSEYSVDILLESYISVQSNSTYTTDEGFVENNFQEFEPISRDFISQEFNSNLNNFENKNKYIIKQNGIVEENNVIFSDEELKIDDSDKEYLPTEDKALNFFFIKENNLFWNIF